MKSDMGVIVLDVYHICLMAGMVVMLVVAIADLL